MLRPVSGNQVTAGQRTVSVPAAIAAVVVPYVVFAGLNGVFNGPLYRASPATFWAVDFFFSVVWMAAGSWLLARLAGIRPADYGLPFPPPRLNELAAASLFFTAMLLLAYFVPRYLVWMLAGYPTSYFSYMQVIPKGPLHGFVASYMAVTAGIVESIMFLGLPWLLWRRLFGDATRRWLFVWLSAVIFASVHWEQGVHGVVGALAFGYLACMIYLKIRDLWPIVIGHVATDLIAFW